MASSSRCSRSESDGADGRLGRDRLGGHRRGWLQSGRDIELCTQLLESAFQKPGDRAGCPIERHADFGQGASLPVVQDECLALMLGQARERIGQQDRLLVLLRDFAGLACSRASQSPAGADDCSSFSSSDRSRDTSRFCRPWARKTSATLRAKIFRSHAACSAGVLPRNCSRFSISLHERLLHDVGWINAARRVRSELDPRQEPQVIAKPLETTLFRKITCLHLRPLTIEPTRLVRSAPVTEFASGSIISGDHAGLKSTIGHWPTATEPRKPSANAATRFRLPDQFASPMDEKRSHQVRRKRPRVLWKSNSVIDVFRAIADSTM